MQLEINSNKQELADIKESLQVNKEMLHAQLAENERLRLEVEELTSKLKDQQNQTVIFNESAAKKPLRKSFVIET